MAKSLAVAILDGFGSYPSVFRKTHLLLRRDLLGDCFRGLRERVNPGGVPAQGQFDLLRCDLLGDCFVGYASA